MRYNGPCHRFLRHPGQRLGRRGRLSSVAQGAAAARSICNPSRRTGGVVCFNFDNIRYLTGTHIGEWARDKFMRYALCGTEGPALLWDPAAPAKRVSSAWIAEHVAAPISTMQGGLPPWLNVQDDFARQIKKTLVDLGIEGAPVGIDIMELPMLRALEAAGIEVVDGQQAMLDCARSKNAGRDRVVEAGRRNGRRNICRRCTRHPPRHARK